VNGWKIKVEYQAVTKYVDCYRFLEKIDNDGCINFPKLNPYPSADIIVHREYLSVVLLG
jgi:hypothetical protein